ncbi:MAG: aminotransferase class I/II-fold pyridoxal phosphate-dependent enzyme [Armatimonadota bacterium]
MRDPITLFERAFAELLRVSYAVAVCSGTGGLLAALLALEPRTGAEIVVGAYGWPQLVAAVRALGLGVRFVDSDMSGRLTAAAVQRALTPSCLAVVVCHLFGNPSEARLIRRIGDQTGVAVLEDCSQALLARQGGLPVGTWGHIGFASIGRDKLLSGTEGGVVWTNDHTLYRRLFALTQHPHRAGDGRLARECLVRSLSLRMHPCAATEGLQELKRLAKRVASVSAAHEKLRVLLQGAPGIRLPEVLADAVPAWSHFVFCSDCRLSHGTGDLLADTRPAYLLAERPEFANAVRFDASAHFIDSGRSWEHVSDQALGRIAGRITQAASQTRAGD